MASATVLVIGVGNVSRRDDGLGWFAANAVRERLGLAPLGEFDDGLDDVDRAVDCVALPQLTPELAETAAGYDRLIVVDARVGGDGGVTVTEAGALQQGARLLSHELALADLLSLCRVLYGRKPDAYLVTAPGSDYDFGVGLSPAMQALLPEVVAAVEELGDRSQETGVRRQESGDRSQEIGDRRRGAARPEAGDGSAVVADVICAPMSGPSRPTEVGAGWPARQAVACLAAERPPSRTQDLWRPRSVRPWPRGASPLSPDSHTAGHRRTGRSRR